MKKITQVILILFVFCSVGILAQTAKIKTQWVSPRTMGTVTPGTNPVYSGNKTVAKHMLVSLTADTAGGVNAFTWSITGPTGTATTLSSTNTQNTTFLPDTSGYYYVTLEVNGGSTDVDTFFASTYRGVTGTAPNCTNCHSGVNTSYTQTAHANVFKEGITGELEVANGFGVYSIARCAKCHTTGWDQSANNGNFGYLSHKSGYDTAWAATYIENAGEYLIPQGDQTAWNLLTTDAKYKDAAPVANIGCESCHGPGEGHAAAFGANASTNISVSLDAGVCLQCHDAPTHHTIGEYYVTSAHATLPHLEARTACFPCHGGTAYYKYIKNPTTPGYVNEDATPISCATCHDPHDANNFGLRIAPTIKLANGFTITTGGNGQMCMTCHQARKNGETVINDTPPYYGFSDRFDPHHGPQTDMLLGQNGYQFGDASITGLMTHGKVTQDACVTCHMANIGSGNSPSHQWSMVDTTGGTHDFVASCVNCHGPITSFDDIQASSDLDGNGVVEGVQTEVEGMLAKLASLLPKDSQNPTVVANRMYDSLLVKNEPAIVKGIYTYYFVEEDKSMGVHNTKYTVALLSKALAELGSVVPVELVSFHAVENEGMISLKWETASETNNSGFEVERKNGNSWNKIAFIKGNGTSSNINSYSYSDKPSGLENVVTYRLKQIDLDGSAHFSKEVEVSLSNTPKSFSLSQNYPNPFNPSTVIKYVLPFESKVKIVIYNLTGEVVKTLVNSTEAAGTHEANFNTSASGLSLSSGIYFYSMEAVSIDGSQNFRQTKKMILLK